MLFYVVYIPFLRSILRISVRILLAHLLFSAALLKAAPETRTFSKGGVPSLFQKRNHQKMAGKRRSCAERLFTLLITP